MPESLTTASDASRAIPEVWGRVPLRNKNFTGRAELLEHLGDSLAADVNAVVVTALHGLGGVGKTQVAVEYAYRYASNYDLVWWISADQPMLVRASLAALAPHLGLPSAAATGIEDAASAVLDALRRGQPYHRWLLIFDNADQPEDISDILPRGPGHVLITSRNHRWEGVVDTVPVDVFTREESVAFLNKRVPKGVNATDADRLAEQLGDLPLALEQAAALQAETGMSVEQYLQLFNEQTAKLLAEGKPSEYPVSMTVAWSLSVSQLKDKLPEAVELLRCCAFFGPEPIPRDVFVPLAEDMRSPAAADTGQPFGLNPQLNLLLNDPILLSSAIRELGRFALVKIDPTSRTVQVHRLVQALLRNELSEPERNSIRHVTHMLLANAAPKSPPDMVPNWPRYGELLGHAKPSQIIRCPHPLVRSFCLDVARYLYTSGDLSTAEEFIQETIDAWLPDSGPNDLAILDAQRHLGIVLRELGEYAKSYELNRATLERMRAVFGPEHEQTLLLTNSYGADLRAQGRFSEAKEHDEESLRMHEFVFGSNDRRTLRCMNNLAVDYGLMSDYDKAVDLHKETFQRQRIPGSGVSAQDTLICWNGLARAVRLSGKYADAVDLGEDAYAFSITELGPQHPWTLRTAKDLSIAQRMSSALEESLEIAEETYEKELRRFGPRHPDTLAAAMNLANARRVTGQVEEGFAVAADAMEKYSDVFGLDHPYVHGCMVNMALLHRTRGDVERAHECDEASYAALTDAVGPDHHFTLTCALNLASDHAALGRPDLARELGETTLERLRKQLGEDHPLTIGCAANLVLDRRSQGASEEADQLADKVRAQYDRILGLDHADAEAFLADRRVEFDIDPPPI